MYEAARITDPIAHTSALAGFLVGAVIGIALIAAVAFATFTCGFGVALIAGLAAGVGASAILALGEGIGKMFSSPAGTIATGSPNVYANSLASAYATASTVACSKHNPVQMVAEGSGNVFINSLPAARKKDATTCGGKIDGGSSNVYIGGGTVQYMEVADEVPPWLRTTVDWAFALAGLAGGLAGLAKAAGGMSRALLPCAAKFIGGFVIGEAVSRYVIAPVASRVMGGLFGHPVEVATGRKVLLATEEIDFVVKSPIPLVGARFYASNLDYEGSLGKGWVLPWELRLQARGDRLWYTDGQGRETGFPMVAPGHTAFSEAEQCYLACTEAGQFILYDLNEAYYDFGHLEPAGAVAWVQRVEDRTGQWHSYHRDDAGRVQMIRTSGGQQLQLHYSGPQARLANVECTHGGSPGPLVTYGYDGAGQLVSVTDANGDVARRFSYADGLMTSHTNALGLVCSYAWERIDGQMRVVACGSSEGERTTFGYDPAARRSWATDELGRTAHWTYDEHFQIVACTDLDGGAYRMQYNAAGQPVLIELPGERSIAFEFDQAGRIVGETDPLGRTTRTAYDGNSLRVALLALPDGRTWKAQYDYLGRLLRTTDPLDRHESWEYDAGLSPLPLVHVDARGGRQQMSWDRRGLMTSSTDCSGKVTRYAYDADGHVAAITNALGERTRFERRRTGEMVRITMPDGSVDEIVYDPAGLVVERRDAGQEAKRWIRNARGLVLDAVDGAGRHLRHRYDSQGRLIELATDERTSYGFDYDAGDRLTREVRPDGVERRLQYDAAGELAVLYKVGVPASPGSEAPLKTTLFKRDKMGRLLSQTTATAACVYEWDDGDRLLAGERIPSEAGLALGLSANTVRFDYDRAGRLLAEHGSEGRVGYAFDELDNLTALELPFAQRIDLLSYGSGHVHQIRGAGQVVSDIERDDLHREVLRTQGHLTQRIGYDALGRRAWQAAAPGAEVTGPGMGRLWRSYRYHPSGELSEQRDSLRGTINSQYDGAGQLQRQTRAPRGHDIGRQEQFAWDAAGNLLDDISRKSRGHVDGNRLRVWQDLRFEYDPWGNLSVKRKGAHDVQRYVFDGDDRLIAVFTDNVRGSTETRFDYDAIGRRIATTEARAGIGGQRAATDGETRRFVWQGMRMVQEVRGSRVSSYVYHPDEFYTPLARIDAVAGAAIDAAASAGATQGARLYHFHTDAIGVPLEVSDEAGEIAWAGQYSAWGKANGAEDDTLLGGIEQPLRYPGQYADSGTGLHYNTFRFYDPDIGRYISADPVGLEGGDNLYAYAPNPTGWEDPLGWRGNPAKATHITYEGVKNGKPYIGYASMPGLGHDAQTVLNYRYSSTAHFDVAPTPVYVGDGKAGKAVARGLEQRLFEQRGGLAGTSNRQNPVGINNKNRTRYLRAADKHLAAQNKPTTSGKGAAGC